MWRGWCGVCLPNRCKPLVPGQPPPLRGARDDLTMPRLTTLEVCPLSLLPDMSGIIAWARREEWRAALAERIELHAAPACAAAGIPVAEIETILGEYGGSTVWGAAFEDLLATELPDGRNLADDYLRRRGWKESAITRDYITGLRRSVISLYEVSGLVPGESLLLRDLVRGGEPVRVMEKSGSRGLRQWDHVATRVVPLRQHHVASGVLMVFDRKGSDALLAALGRIRERAPQEVAAVARELGVAADGATLAAEFTPEQMLAQAAFMLTSCWLDAALTAARGGDRPEVVNAEGDPIEFTQVHFPLRSGVTAERVRRALSGVTALRQENADFWNWLAEPRTKPTSVPRKADAQTFVSTMDDGALVLGTVSLKGRRLTLEANSPARAERGKALLESAVAGLVGTPLTERNDLDSMLAKERPPPAPSGLSPEQERALVHQTLDDHYRRIMDEPIPALGGKSPRAAARTPKGREKVAAWLKTLENHGAHRPPDDPMASYDVGWMWEELGVEALRR